MASERRRYTPSSQPQAATPTSPSGIRMNAVARTVRSVAVTESSFAASSAGGIGVEVVEEHLELGHDPLHLLLDAGAAVAVVARRAGRGSGRSRASAGGRSGGPRRRSGWPRGRRRAPCGRARRRARAAPCAASRPRSGSMRVLERVGLRVDQAERLDGAQVPGGLDAGPGEPAGPVLGDDRRPHGERAERHDRQRHAGHGDRARARDGVRRRCCACAMSEHRAMLVADRRAQRQSVSARSRISSPRSMSSAAIVSGGAIRSTLPRPANLTMFTFRPSSRQRSVTAMP